MSRIQPTYSDRVRYTLQHDESGSAEIQEPIGWRNDDTEFVRDKKYHGVLQMMTADLKFVDNGYDYILSVYSIYGINADLRMVKDERNPNTDVFERVYDGFLDLSTLTIEDNVLSCKFTSSGLAKLIKSRESEKLELARIDTLSGKALEPMANEVVALSGRKIFLKSLLEVPNNESITHFFMRFTDGNYREGALGVPVTATYKSDVHVHNVNVDSMTAFGGETPDTAEVQQLFYADNDRDKTLNLEIKLTATTNVLVYEDMDNQFFRLVLAIYKNSTDYEIKERIVLEEAPIDVLLSGYEFNVDYSTSLDLLEGESLSLQWFGGGEFGGTFDFGEMYFRMQDIVSSINIEEDSFFEPTQSKFYLPHEMAQRYVQIITDRDDAFYSEVFGRTDILNEDGTRKYPNITLEDEQKNGALCGSTHGYWVRSFDDDKFIDNELGEPINGFKPFTSSFKDFRESYFNVWNLGMGIEKIGFQERVRIEELGYFYNRNILIRIGKMVNGTFVYSQVNNVKRTVAIKEYNSSIDFGYDRVEDYEEAVGLDEYNMQTNFTTHINKVDTKLMKLSKYRADGYGLEFARREQYELDPLGDTKYDKHNFLLDLKRSLTPPVDENGVFSQRLWEDDFVVSPTGIYSPETAQNLRLSPANELLRHGNFVSSGLTKYPDKYIRFGSSTLNSDLTTQLIGGNPISENGTGDSTEIIQNRDLDKARYVPEYIEFEHEVDFELLKQVTGKTVVLGKEITNFYGRVSFLNERNQIESGFLINLKPNGQGTWKVLKYNE